MVKISEYCGASLDYIVFGKVQNETVESSNISDDVSELDMIYSKLDYVGQQKLLSYARGMADALEIRGSVDKELSASKAI